MLESVHRCVGGPTARLSQFSSVCAVCKSVYTFMHVCEKKPADKNTVKAKGNSTKTTWGTMQRGQRASVLFACFWLKGTWFCCFMFACVSWCVPARSFNFHTFIKKFINSHVPSSTYEKCHYDKKLFQCVFFTRNLFTTTIFYKLRYVSIGNLHQLMNKQMQWHNRLGALEAWSVYTSFNVQITQIIERCGCICLSVCECECERMFGWVCACVHVCVLTYICAPAVCLLVL